MKKILSVLVAILVFSSCVNFSVLADAGFEVIYSAQDGKLASSTTAMFKWTGRESESQMTESLGGKSATDTYTQFKTSSSKDAVMEIVPGDSAYSKAYTMFSMELYGNSIPVNCIGRFSSSVKPKLSTIGVDLLSTGWNYISVVFEKATTNIDLYINGKYIKTSNLNDLVKGYTIDGYNGTIPNFQFIPAKRGAISYCDNVSMCISDEYPEFNAPYVIENEDFENKSQVIISGPEGVALSAEEGAYFVVSSDSGSTWTEKESVAVGDMVLVSKDMVCGDVVYGRMTKIYKCVDASYSAELISQSTMSYNQGGSPKDADGNGISDTRYNVQNLYGSDKEMTYVGVGVNNQSSSKQSYYYYDWVNANNYPAKYLVAEFDFAFPQETDLIKAASSLNITTNGGGSISTSVGSKTYAYQNRINHFVWIYDTQTGIYEEYINGVVINKGAKMRENFVNGTNTAMRFTVSMSSDNSGLKQRQYAAYMNNIVVSETNTKPEIKQPLCVPGSKISTLPVTEKTVAVSDIKAMFDEADREYVKVYTNGEFTELAEDGATVEAGKGVIVTNKDSICDYAKICLAPSENADYAVESIDVDSDGNMTVSLLNYGKKRNMMPVMIGFKGSDIADLEFAEQLCESSGTISVKMPVGNSEKIELMVWESFDSLKPLGSVIDIK